MARIATEKLLAQINGESDAAAGIEVMVSPEFESRESTGPAQGG
jgi:DNA-binding LacI/PurR family transcriptional regulator